MSDKLFDSYKLKTGFDQLAMTRRAFVSLGALSAFGIGFWSRSVVAVPSVTGNQKRAILIWLDGGPSHLDTFDPKPQASAEVRGPFGTIATSIPGIRLSELMPLTARLLNKTAIIRSMTSPLGEHNLGAQYMLTGYKPTPAIAYPVLGSVVNHLSAADSALPNFVAVPDHRVGGALFSACGFLPTTSGPFEIAGDPSKPNFQVKDMNFAFGLDQERAGLRRNFLTQLDRSSQAMHRISQAPDHRVLDQALGLLTSEKARSVFRLDSEPSSIRQRYGNHTLGQSCLLARRLVDSGVRFVTVNNPGWDTHENAYTRLKEGYTGATNPVGLVPKLDQGLSALIRDLDDRGTLNDTLIIVMGEFGRTPKINAQGGRDHWPRAFSMLLAGGGVPGGQVIGESDPQGESPKDNPITPSDLAATIYTLLGLAPTLELTTSDGRPIRLSRDGIPVREVIG